MFGKSRKISGFVLRLLQCVFAAISMGVMFSAPKFSNCKTFSCLIFAMGVEFLWSFILCCMDVCSLRLTTTLYTPTYYFILICIVDWVVGFVCLGVACASVAVLDFLHRYDMCNSQIMPCNMYCLSITMAFVAWFFIAVSAIVMFRLVASSSY